MSKNERAAIAKVRRSIKEWINAKRKADRLREQFVPSRSVREPDTWRNPLRTLDGRGMAELKNADTAAYEKWQRHQQALTELRTLTKGDNA